MALRIFGGAGGQSVIVITYTPVALPAGSAANFIATRSSSFAYDPGSGLLTQEVVEPNTSVARRSCRCPGSCI